MFSWMLKGAGLVKTGWAMFAPYRLWVVLAAAAVALTTVLVFYGNCRANTVALDNADKLIQDLKIDLTAARVELVARNGRIRALNDQRRAELAEAEKLLRESVVVARKLRDERDEAILNLQESRFELLEAIRDDEEMADWVDNPVPISAWSLLQQTADRAAGRDVRADH